MGRDGWDEPFVKAHKAGAVPVLSRVRDMFSPGANDNQSAEDASKPEEYFFEDDLEDLMDRPIAEQMAELQDMINACGQEDALLNAPIVEQRKDPVAQLKSQCDSIREEVMSLVAAKRSIERNLQQDVQNLQERVWQQGQEKASMAQRLSRVSQSFQGKRQEMLERKLDMEVSLSLEREQKEQLRTDFTTNLRNLREELRLVNDEIQTEWKDQMAAVKEMDACSDLQFQYQSELAEERENNWRQNREVLSQLDQAGKAMPASLVSASNEAEQREQRMKAEMAVATAPQCDAPEGGSVHQPSIRCIYPFGILRSITGVAEFRQQEQADRETEELRNRLELERNGWTQKQVEVAEEQKNIVYSLWIQRCKAQECKQRLALVQHHNNNLKKRMPDVKSRAALPENPCMRSPDADTSMTDSPLRMPSFRLPSPSALSGSMASASQPAQMERLSSMVWSPSCGSLSGSPGTKNEMGEALKLAEDLRQRKKMVEEKQQELEVLQREHQSASSDAVILLSSSPASSPQQNELRAAELKRICDLGDKKDEQLRLRQTSIDQRSALVKEEAELKQKLDKRLYDTRRIADLETDIQRKTGELNGLKIRNDELFEQVKSLQSCCWSKPSKPPPAAKGKGRTEQQVPAEGGGRDAAKGGGKSKSVGKSALRSEGKGKGEMARSAPVQASNPAGPTPATSSTSAPTPSLGQDTAGGVALQSTALRTPVNQAPPTSTTSARTPTISFAPEETPTGGRDVPSRRSGSADGAPAEKKKAQWKVSHKERVCSVGEEPWKSLAGVGIMEALADGDRPAQSVAEAVQFLQANPGKNPATNYFLVKDSGAWWCIYKSKSKDLPLARQKLGLPVDAGTPAGQRENTRTSRPAASGPASSSSAAAAGDLYEV